MLEHNVKEYSVSEISDAVKNIIENNFDYVRIRGEISGSKRAPSGHIYLSLKDNNAVISAICWQPTSKRLKIQIEDGLEVIASGRVTTYQGQSKYQLIIENITHAGEGALAALLLKRKEKLQKEGLFDQDRKKPIPFFPNIIGIITSPTGAVIKDIIHRIEERFPTHIKLWPVNVQGETAAAQIAAAIEGFNNMTYGKPDILIVARGGGSLEDLWAFNEEITVRAAAASKIPLISAIGHETDTTLIDYAADKRAPTPTAAAEFATPVRADLIANLNNLKIRQINIMERIYKTAYDTLIALQRAMPDIDKYFDNLRQKIDFSAMQLSNALPKLLEFKEKQILQLKVKLKNPEYLIELNSSYLINLSGKLTNGLEKFLKDKSSKLELNTKLLQSYNYKNTLKRGFAVIKQNNKLIKSAKNIDKDAIMDIEFYDGNINVKVK